ncbi:MAG: flagellar motor protein MotB [Candidatus Omnitrophica bacterium]|nr:flagellar motor protein MotB [Candidatus Omnitrophota bacterium]
MKAKLIIMILLVFMLSGCTYIQKARRTDALEIENANLRNRVAQLQKEKTKEVRQVYAEKDKELSDLEQAKRELEESLKKEIGEYKAKLQMTERGLVITFVSEIFFDSGKDKVKEDGKIALGKVAEVLNRDVPNSNIAVEGHTDNDPIKYSGWKSNWELSSARALAVLHYLIGEGQIKPQRLSANGYGEFHPVAPNDSVQGKQKNRRVEIVILPSKLSKVKSK